MYVIFVHSTPGKEGSVGEAGEWSHTCTLETFWLYPLALSMLTYCNFQVNRVSGETFYAFLAFFTTIKEVIF